MILLVGHGSRDAAGNDAVRALAAAIRARRGAADAAFVELATPTVGDGLDAAAAVADDVVVAPVFLLTAGHVKNDLPVALAQARDRHRRVRFTAARPVGAAPALVAALRARAIAATADPARAALILVGRGSGDPDANAEVCRVARLVGEGAPWAHRAAAFAAVADPGLPAALEAAARQRPSAIVVVPYLLFPGRVLDRLDDAIAAFAGRAPWITVARTAPVGVEDALVAALLERVDEARGGRELACDGCQYRIPVAGPARVGGLRALLASVRHQLTAGAALPHRHRPLAKHVLVCGNVDCAGRGSLRVLGALRAELRARALDGAIAVTRTACLGRCADGPTVAVYPDGVWYRGVAVGDAAELVAEHLVADRLVARLVDAVLT